MVRDAARERGRAGRGGRDILGGEGGTMVEIVCRLITFLENGVNGTPARLPSGAQRGT